MPQKEIDVFKLLERGAFRAGIERRTAQARNWFIKQTRGMQIQRNQLLNHDYSRPNVRGNGVGRMYMFLYDAKTKEKLPYWDRFPCSIFIENYSDGFLGLNLHYLGLRTRGMLLGRLYDLMSKTLTESTRINISYDLIRGFSRFPEARPCVKRYLAQHIKSEFVEIPAADWEIAAFLPVESFVGASRDEVWRQSSRKI